MLREILDFGVGMRKRLSAEKEVAETNHHQVEKIMETVFMVFTFEEKEVIQNQK